MNARAPGLVAFARGPSVKLIERTRRAEKIAPRVNERLPRPFHL